MFKQLRPLLLIHRDLARIASCLEFIVRQEARRQNVLWNSGKRVGDDGVEPELFHTDPAEMAALQADDAAHFSEHGEGDGFPG